MTTFAEMRTLVIDLTKRPELVSLTDYAIRMATLRAHQVDFFPRDQANVPLLYAPLSANEIFVDIPDLYTQVPLLRTPDFVQGEDATTLLPNEQLEHVVDYKDFYNEYNELRYSVFTQMGDLLRCRFIAPTGRLRLFYYKNPNITVPLYSSWIADMYPEEVAMWAAGLIWQRTGFQEQASTVARETIPQFKDILITSHLSSKV
jgi:hypothetical protein